MPKNRLTYRKGDIRWVKLDPTMGAEAQKTRACLIVQSDVIRLIVQSDVILCQVDESLVGKLSQ